MKKDIEEFISLGWIDVITFRASLQHLIKQPLGVAAAAPAAV